MKMRIRKIDIDTGQVIEDEGGLGLIHNSEGQVNEDRKILELELRNQEMIERREEEGRVACIEI